MRVSDEAKNVIPLKFLRKIKNKNVFPLVNSIRGHTVYYEGLRMYNKLPREIKNCTIMLKFKQLLRVYVRKNF
jgi:hypothetical protein